MSIVSAIIPAFHVVNLEPTCCNGDDAQSAPESEAFCFGDESGNSRGDHELILTFCRTAGVAWPSGGAPFGMAEARF